MSRVHKHVIQSRGALPGRDWYGYPWYVPEGAEFDGRYGNSSPQYHLYFADMYPAYVFPGMEPDLAEFGYHGPVYQWDNEADYEELGWTAAPPRVALTPHYHEFDDLCSVDNYLTLTAMSETWMDINGELWTYRDIWKWAMEYGFDEDERGTRPWKQVLADWEAIMTGGDV